MNVNADLDATVFQTGVDFTWHPSPVAGVERVLLDRVGGEVAVATSIVRYAPGSSFDAHSHALGEEFIVLDGVFSDENGDYPAGTYIRNPPGTSHTPHSEAGCVIWGKLRQFDDAGVTPVQASIPDFAPSSDAQVEQIYTYGAEAVSWVHLPAGTRLAFSSHYHVRELVVLTGQLTWQQEKTRTLGPWSWIRMSPGQPLRVNAVQDCVLFSKTRPIYRRAEG